MAIGKPAFQPVAAPVQVGGRLARAVDASSFVAQQSTVGDIANSLARLNPALGELGAAYVNEQQAKAAAQYAEELASTPDDKLDAYHQAASQQANVYSAKALDAQFGSRVAQARVRAIRDKIDSGEIDLATADMDGFLKGAIEGDLGRYKSDAFSSTYVAAMTQAQAAFRNAAGEARAKRVRDEMDQGYFELLTGAAEDGKRAGLSGQDIAAKILAVRQSHAGAMSRDRLNDGMAKLFVQLSDSGEVGTLTALRDTPMGEKDPAFGKLKEYAQLADQAVRQGESRRSDIQTKAHFDELSKFFSKVNEGTISADGVSKEVARLRGIGIEISPHQEAAWGAQAVNAREAAAARAERVADKKQAEENNVTLANLAIKMQKGELTSAQVEAMAPDLLKKGVTYGAISALHGGAMSREEEAAKLEAKAQAIHAIEMQHQETVAKNTTALMAGTTGSEVKDMEVPTPSGGTRTYTAKEQISDAIDNYVNNGLAKMFDPAIAKAEADGDTAKAAELRTAKDNQFLQTVANAGITDYAPLRQRLTAGYFSARAEGFAGPESKSALDLYKRMRAIDPTWAKGVIGNDDAAQFYDNVDFVARNVFQGDTDMALQNAKRQEANAPELKDFRIRWSGKDQLQKITKDTIQAMSDKTGILWFDDDFKGSNVAVQGEILRSAEAILAHNLAPSEEQALALAGKKYAEDHVQVGPLHYPVASVNLKFPQALPQLSKEIGQAIVAQLPEYKDDKPNNFAVVPSLRDGSRFDVIDLRTMSPIPGNLKVQAHGIDVPLSNIGRMSLDTLKTLADSADMLKVQEKIDAEKKRKDEARAKGEAADFNLGGVIGGVGSGAFIEIGKPNPAGLFNNQN